MSSPIPVLGIVHLEEFMPFTWSLNFIYLFFKFRRCRRHLSCFAKCKWKMTDFWLPCFCQHLFSFFSVPYVLFHCHTDKKTWKFLSSSKFHWILRGRKIIKPKSTLNLSKEMWGWLELPMLHYQRNTQWQYDSILFPSAVGYILLWRKQDSGNYKCLHALRTS